MAAAGRVLASYRIARSWGSQTCEGDERCDCGWRKDGGLAGWRGDMQAIAAKGMQDRLTSKDK